MKKKQTKGRSNPATTTENLLPLDEAAIIRILDDITGETPEVFASRQATRRIETACRLAWCEVTEAGLAIQADNPTATRAKLAETAAQRKLTGILDGLMPAISTRNKAVAAATEQRGFVSYLKEDAEPFETEAALLKARDARINSGGELPNVQSMEDEINLLENLFTAGNWARSSLDFRDAAFMAELGNLRDAGKYTGELTKEAAEQRLADLSNQISALQSMIENMLDRDEIQRVQELETKLSAIREEIASAEDKAAAMEAKAADASEDLKVKIEAAGIMAIAIIQAYQIQTAAAPVAA